MTVLGVLRKCVAFAPVFMLLSSPAAMAQGKMWHTIRYADGTWHEFGDVTTQAGWPGSFGPVSISGNTDSGELHVVGGADCNLWHTIRYADGTWQQFGDVTAEAGNPGCFESVATALIGGDLHVVATTAVNGKMWHTIRYADGTWHVFGDVTTQAGRPGYFMTVSIAGNNASGELHVVGQTIDGKLWHTIRNADGTWHVFGDVTRQAGWPGYFESVGTGLIGGDLHVAATTGNGKMWHTIRYANGKNWQVFGDVTQQAGWPGYFAEVSIAGNNASGGLHVVGQVDGKLWHTIRYANGWHVFGDVTNEAGWPGYFTFVATAFIGDDLHVVATDPPQIIP